MVPKFQLDEPNRDRASVSKVPSHILVTATSLTVPATEYIFKGIGVNNTPNYRLGGRKMHWDLKKRGRG
ncbi:hypothetical protein TNCV_4389461 [Trichonephila clavipes]|uniref:Uncharacterized protein n=2 Tax=Trichonephila TaxID=2585208 RepID=A0A8X6H3L1_TRICU|nr:hypothetical protein TNCT_3101 [Trichonephila clavata]GFV11990.1 hypothetical protein TNCV_4389461 [Trichonephila clavipes]GFY69130.1 hypothetical protein TNIN_221771 [Trichonephila inaurata madagascariensis]